jgi:hypothetical protein
VPAPAKNCALACACSWRSSAAQPGRRHAEARGGSLAAPHSPTAGSPKAVGSPAVVSVQRRHRSTPRCRRAWPPWRCRRPVGSMVEAWRETKARVDEYGYGFTTSIPASARPVGSKNLLLRDSWVFPHHTLLHLMRVPIATRTCGAPYHSTCALGRLRLKEFPGGSAHFPCSPRHIFCFSFSLFSIF